MMLLRRFAVPLSAGRASLPCSYNRCLKCCRLLSTAPFKTLVPTQHYQDSLPQLPLPDLEATCQRYLRVVEPITSKEQFENTQRAVRDFQHRQGPELQKMLQEYVKNHPSASYVSEYWDNMYLEQREPLMFNSSVGTWDQEVIKEGFADQSIRATNLLVSSLKFMQHLENQTLEPYHINAKVSKANKHMIRFYPKSVEDDVTPLKPIIPLSMSQFKHIFKATRIPRLQKDELVTFPDSRHIVVLKNGHFFSLDVLDEAGCIKAPEMILSQLRQIEKKDCIPPEHPVTVLTADNRDFWCKAREALINSGNGNVVNEIDSAIMLIVFDESYPDVTSRLRASVQGDGTNRWFDKPYNYVISTDGEMFSLMEHSWGDGIAGVYMKGWTNRDVQKCPSVGPDTRESHDVPAVRELNFKLNDEVKTLVRESMQRFKEVTSKLDLQYYLYTRYGSDFIKTKKISPDALSQTAFQIAYKKLFGVLPTTYESCTTAIFKKGRTETMRPVTPLSKKFCDAFLSQTHGKEELCEMLRNSSQLHTKLVAEASAGFGCDRHLYAMLKLSQSLGGPIPDIFTDPTFAHAMCFRLSTSTMGSHSVGSMAAFAPVTSDGFGIYYLMASDHFDACITCYKPAKETEPFIQALTSTFDELHDLIQ